ncbi:phosphoribosylaminoimidazole carboxylase, PurK protein/phosphoribosylaminoimidazole carboxylase, PurE protein, partial [Streptomyces sp. Ncost-T6T-2b]
PMPWSTPRDKGVMRARLAEIGAPCPRNRIVSDPADAAAFAEEVGGFPVILKTVRGGYDGKGVWVVRSEADAADPFRAGVPVLAEEKVDFVRELAANIVRSPHGQAVAYPVVESIQVDGVCDTVIAPAPELDETLAGEAQQLALRIAAELDVVGHLAVELFETRDGRILVNELAMRPHNSGHWTQDGAITSQFANHVRAVLDLPLGDPRPPRPLDGHVQRPGRRLPGHVPGLPALHGPRPAAQDPHVRQGREARPQGRPRQHLRRRSGGRAGARPARGRLPARNDHRMTSPSAPAPVIGIVMGSDSDWPVMEAAAKALDEFEIPYEVDVVSAHRMPREMIAYGEEAAGRGLKAIIAGAGGAAHLPGMLASVTPLPVIGVPVPLKYLDGMDSLLSIVQMPAGVPVATVSVGGARNAGLLAARILAASDPALQERMGEFLQELNDQATEKGKRLRSK